MTINYIIVWEPECWPFPSQVRRVLLQKFAAGLFDRPVTDPGRIAELNSPAHQALALKAAEEGIVMLLNRPKAGGTAPLLPLDQAEVKKIAVVGPNGGW
eukprot:COSAG01_NODE_246_length_20450_cov_195.166822_28_plen_99_part_00